MSRSTLGDLEAACVRGDLAAIWRDGMLGRLARLNKRDLAEAKRAIWARFGRRAGFKALCRNIREKRECWLEAERKKAFGGVAGSSGGSPRDPLSALFARRGGLVRCRKGFAAMSPERAAEIRAQARAASQERSAGRRRGSAQERPAADYPAKRAESQPSPDRPDKREQEGFPLA